MDRSGQHRDAHNRLRHLKAARLKIPGIYEDGGGLRLLVGDSLTRQRYVLPKIGTTPVAEVEAVAILDVLTPIWFAKPETARRVLQRMEAVFCSTILRDHRKLASPCIGVAEELGARHHPGT